MHVQSCYFATQHVLIEVQERKSDCPEPKTFKNFFPQKSTDLALRIWRFHGESVRGSLMRERFVS